MRLDDQNQAGRQSLLVIAPRTSREAVTVELSMSLFQDDNDIPTGSQHGRWIQALYVCGSRDDSILICSIVH